MLVTDVWSTRCGPDRVCVRLRTRGTARTVPYWSRQRPFRSSFVVKLSGYRGRLRSATRHVSTARMVRRVVGIRSPGGG